MEDPLLSLKHSLFFPKLRKCVDIFLLENFFGYAYLRVANRTQSKTGKESESNFRSHTTELLMTVLTAEQRQLIYQAMEDQQTFLNDYLSARSDIVDGLLPFQKQSDADPSIAIEACTKSGKLDGQIAYREAKAFGDVYKSLSQAQKDELYKRWDDLIADAEDMDILK